MAKKIKKPSVDTSVSLNKKSDEQLPIFCFKHFQISSIKNCTKDQLHNFIDRLQRLAELGWNEINRSGRHDYGWEHLPISTLKCQLPQFVTPEVSKVMVFRYNNANNPFIAVRSESDRNLLHILLIEANFGEVYDHN